MTTTKVLPLRESERGRVSREEAAQIEIGHTDIRRGVALLLTLFFLVMIFALPAGQHAIEFLHGKVGNRLSSIPQAWDIFRVAQDAIARWRQHKRSLDHLFTVNQEVLRKIKQYSDRLEEESWFNQQVLPITQNILSNIFGVGNEKVYVGSGDWLFYRPGIDYLIGDGFLNSSKLARDLNSNDAGKPSRQADPVQAIVQFKAQLAARGIELILMPVPDKASVHAERFTDALAGDRRALHNRSYDQFLAALQSQGIRVFDPTDLLAEFADKHGGSAYLATDTHWSPRAMEGVAAALAAELRPLLPSAPTEPLFRRETATVQNHGDLAKMLKLPYGARWPAPESVEIRPVRPATASQARVIDPSAEVLLLGDSFANIYSLESMGWGVSAGLAEQLARELNRPVDALRRNDAGAHATREALAYEVARGCGRLAGKKVVIWEFAARELAYGDWKLLDLSPARAAGSPLCGAAGLRALTGAHTRIVWTRAVDPLSKDPGARRAGFRLMGLDTDDGRGVREILRGPISSRKPLLTSDGRRVVFTDMPLGRIGVVDWDGTNLRYVADGFSAHLQADPKTGRTWVYAVAGPIDGPFSGKPLFRFDLDRPEVREVVWDRTEVSLDNFQISADGRYAFGQFPWPKVGIADLVQGTLTLTGGGCWTSLLPENGNVGWIFDGSHRNLLFTDFATKATWTVPIHQAPGVGGFEVYHPRGANHGRFFTMSGPYKEGEGDNRIGQGGREVEIYVGRFSADLRRVERWAKITTDEESDFFPDVWINPNQPPAFNPNDVEAPNAHAKSTLATGPIVVDARLAAVTLPPTLQAIAPYRQALVVYAYEVVKVHSGTATSKRILVQHWALRDGRTVVPHTRVGEIVRLALNPVESHSELQGERVIKDMTDTALPTYYAAPR